MQKPSRNRNSVQFRGKELSNTYRFHPNFEGEHPGGGSRVSHLSSPATNLTSGLAARRLFRVPPCREGTIHLQISMSSPGFEPRAYGTAVNVTNHFTWMGDITVCCAYKHIEYFPKNTLLMITKKDCDFYFSLEETGPIILFTRKSIRNSDTAVTLTRSALLQ
ncbi:hypothetical protein TNCV_1786361 [Trichonephila clavipes]|nr:hypothetical protein TNCV_1786361 [Trichonephila clavipes]